MLSLIAEGLRLEHSILPALTLLSTVGLAGGVLHYRSLYRDKLQEQSESAALIDNLSEGIYRSAPDGRQISANAALVKLNGYRSEDEMLAAVKDIGIEWYVDPGRRAEFQALLKEHGRVDDFVSEIYRHKTRERIWITESARLVTHKRTGRPLFYEGSVRDISETVVRLNLEQRFQKLTSELPGALFQIEVPDGAPPRAVYLSRGVTRLTGYAHAKHVADPTFFDSLIVDDDRDDYLKSLTAAARTLTHWETEFRIRSKDGEERWLRISASPQRAGNALVWYGYLSDVSSRKRQEMEIAELAYMDPLTKLPNRRMFLKRMMEETGVRGEDAGHGVLLFIDLDNFKTLNDTHGHDVGDAYLVQVAERLRQCAGEKDTVARIGGDEFVVLLGEPQAEHMHATRDAIAIGNRILAALQMQFTLDEVVHLGSASIGVVVFARQERRVDDILKRADLAMYQAKVAGRNGLALFDPAAMQREAERFRMLGELRAAIAAKRMTLHLQPQMDDNRRIYGAEALVRWDHPTRGLIMPDEFMPLADQFGLSGELATLVLEKGFAVLAEWQSHPATSGLRLALNVGARSFADKSFVSVVKSLIDRFKVDATMLTLELTESIMARDHTHIAAQMSEIKRLGVRLSLDDFGTGYSSIALLKRLPIDEIKIDGSFVHDIETGDGNRALVKTILAMARMLGLKAVAEHVENIRQETFLRAFGCDYFQGYIYAPAMTATVFRDFIGQHSVPELPSNPQIALTA